MPRCPTSIELYSAISILYALESHGRAKKGESAIGIYRRHCHRHCTLSDLLESRQKAFILRLAERMAEKFSGDAEDYLTDGDEEK